ncbi:MAG: hypothetical protein DRJ56_04865 [Thermoprotei archaeon]|nr:MAG: hypothetical protein DRJ56_04865 [Thermoprotei archaeon]
MIEWLSEIGVAVLLVLLIASMYAFHLSMTSLILARTEIEVVKFVTESGLTRTVLDVSDLYFARAKYLSKYNGTLGLRVLPALNITLSECCGRVRVHVRSWSGHVIPSLNFTVMRVVLGPDGVEGVESEKGVVTDYCDTQVTYDENSLYVVLVTYYKLACFEVLAPSEVLRDNYDPRSDELYNESDVLRVYAVLPFYERPFPIQFSKVGDHVRLKVECGTVAFIVVEERGTYVVERFPLLRGGGGFRTELCKYIVCEYYTFMVMAGESS